MKYPVYRPRLGEEEKRNVLDCLDSNWISSKGKYVEEFEKAFAEYHGIPNAVCTTSGTTALHLAMLTLGIGEGDEVLVPTFTYIAPVNSIRYVGAEPVFVDCDEETWQMSVAETERRINNKTRAILAVHVYGHPCRVNELKSLADKHGLFLIEDCAESLGSRIDGRLTGTFGDISIFSFYGNKTITTGEGGMLISSDATLAERAYHYRGQGLAKNREYWHDVIGYNFRMTNICAAIGLAQMERIESVLQEKQTIAMLYEKHLAGVLNIQPCAENCFHSYWMVTVLLNKGDDRSLLRAHLSEHGIETRPAFYPAHTMPMYIEEIEKYPVAESIGRRGMNLPSYPGLTEQDIEFISGCIRSFYESK